MSPPSLTPENQSPPHVHIEGLTCGFHSKVMAMMLYKKHKVVLPMGVSECPTGLNTRSSDPS